MFICNHSNFNTYSPEVDGIYLYDSDNNIFTNFNTTSIEYDGIYIDYFSDNNSFSFFNAKSSNYNGIEIYNSSDNSFYDFNATSISLDGIYLDNSNRLNALKATNIFVSLLWALRLIAYQTLILTIIDSIGKIFEEMKNQVFSTINYDFTTDYINPNYTVKLT